MIRILLLVLHKDLKSRGHIQMNINWSSFTKLFPSSYDNEPSIVMSIPLPYKNFRFASFCIKIIIFNLIKFKEIKDYVSKII